MNNANQRGNDTKQSKKKFFHNEATYIATIYAIFGILWIMLSDQLLEYTFPNIDAYKSFQTYKGWFYILITTLMVYLLIRNRMLLLKKEIHNTAIAYDELSLSHEELVKTKTELDHHRKLIDSIISEAQVFIFTHDEEKIISFNPYAQRVCGYTEEDFKNNTWYDLLVPKEYWMDIQKILCEIKLEKQVRNYEFPILTKEGSLINILWNSNLMTFSSENDESFFVSFGTDINERKRYEEKVENLAFYDNLTGLPNRIKFEKEINRFINMDSATNNFILAYLDIDNFKAINDSMGHQVGDLFLTYLAECLKAEVMEPDIAARLGGDEFAILYSRITKDELLSRIATITQRVSKSWTIENHQFLISMSIGVAIYPLDGTTSTALLKNADIAMFSAKRQGKNRLLFYKEDIKEYNSKHFAMINNLQFGIDEDQFVLYYQPQFSLISGEIVGAEALVRWVHPEEGFILPGDFIPLAEESGQIYKLEQLIFMKALQQKKVWEEQGFDELVMSINLSGKTLTSSINFDELEQIIEAAPVNYDKLAIEITETANILDVEIVIKHLNRLKGKGIKIALDDFGTGYSSLNYLKKLPINIVKLDRSFIDAINENGIDMLLIKNILSLAHDLEFEVVAEGIETKDQLEFLRLHFCELGQGFLLSKPIPEEKMYVLLQDNYKYEN